MTIIFSRHAKRQMRWRKISQHEAAEVVRSPDRIEDSVRNRKNALKIGGRLLQITFSEEIEENKIVIITAIDKSE